MMHSHQIKALIFCATLLGLTACNGDGSSTPGIRVMSQTTYMTSETPSGDPDAETDPASQDSSIKSLYRDDNMYIELQLGLANLRIVELVPCSSIIANAASGLLNIVLGTAHAHSAHIPSGPADVIDVLKPDLLVWDMGTQGTRAGDYCGIKLEIARVAGDSGDEGHHSEMAAEGGETQNAEAGIDMAGKGILVSPCYYPETANTGRTPLDSATPHTCIEAAYSSEAISHVVTFDEPLGLGEGRRAAHLMLATSYDRWFDGLDMTILAEDHQEQAKLAQNVLESFYLYSME